MINPMTVTSLLAGTVERHPERDAVVDGDRRLTYAAWNARINQTAHALAHLGVRPQDRVAVFLHAGEPAATVYFACQKLGAIAVPMNFRISSAEVAHILRDSGARVLVYAAPLTEPAGAALSDSPGVTAAVVVDPTSAPVPGPHHELEELIAGCPDADPTADVTPEMVSALVYTSGTTGRAKGVVHSHFNDVAIALSCALEYRLEADDRALHIAPLYHVGGMQAFFVPHVLVGAANVILPRYEPLRTLHTIRDERVTTLFAVPTQIQQMLHHPQFTPTDVTTLRMITTGGAAIPGATMRRVLHELCPQLFNGYGMTEASLTLLLHPRDALRRLGSCGKPTLISETRIVANDPDRDVHPDEVVPAGQVGQLIVRGPQLTPGYWNKPAESAKRLRHGWLYTGDLFQRDEQGYHYFQGRADDMIVSGGENIYPSEVEEALNHIPGVREAAVVGMPDPKWGSVVTAFIVRADAEVTEHAVDEFFRSGRQLAAFKRPRRIVFVDALPTNPSGKVLKHQLISGGTR